VKEEPITKFSPHLWYTDNADEAAAFYASIFSDAASTASPPSMRACGLCEVVAFTLCKKTAGVFAPASCPSLRSAQGKLWARAEGDLVGSAEGHRR
jgi:3-demethylubiquinone-9 3-methyltransferase